jgi:hypothetical protein
MVEPEGTNLDPTLASYKTTHRPASHRTTTFSFTHTIVTIMAVTAQGTGISIKVHSWAETRRRGVDTSRNRGESCACSKY